MPDPQPDATRAPIDPPAVTEEMTLTLGQGQLAWRRFKRNKLAIASIFVLSLIVLAVVVGPFFTGYNYHEQQKKPNGLLAALEAPSASHWMGTDTLGRDELTRVLYGGRVSIAVGLGVAIAASIIGTFVGAMAGFYGGRLDNLLMRMTDLFLSIPFLVVLVIAANVVGGSVLAIVCVLAAFFWMGDARIVRGVILSLKEKEFVEAARASGATDRRIIISHLIPNTMGPIIVNTTLAVVAAILTESVLSFLGFGIQQPVPTWGNLLNDAQSAMTLAPWLVWFPGAAIFITVLCVNFIGDGLRDALDPQQKIGMNE